MFFLLSLLISTETLAQPLNPSERLLINNFINSIMECRGIPGMSVAAVRGAEVVLAEGYGITNVDTLQPVTRNTLFGLASVTKQFTGILLAKLGDNFGFTWDTPIRQLLGDDFYYSTGFRSNNTNLRDLLAHKTGISRNNYIWLLEAFNNRSDIIDRIRFYEPMTDMRSSFIYNNLMYLVAGRVAEVVSKESYEDLIKEELFDTIGMSSTTFVHVDGDNRTRFATPYWNSSGLLVEIPHVMLRSSGLIAAGGAMASDAEDMGKWLVFLLTGKSDLGTEVMPIELIESTWASDAFGSLNPDERTLILKPYNPVSYVHAGYGKGFNNGYYRGYKLITHPGDLFGYHTIDIILPDLDMGVYIAINKNDIYERRYLSLYVLDVLMGEQPWLNASYVCDVLANLTNSAPENIMTVMPDIQKHIVTRPAEEIPQQQGPMNRENAAYVGVYGNYGYGNLTVTEEGSIGNLTLRFGNAVYELLPLEGDNFITVSVGESWYLNPGLVEFSSSQGEGQEIDECVIPGFELSNPPVFRRGLKLSDAPPPRLDTC